MREQIKLSQFATIKEGSGPSQLERRDKTASVTVKGQTVGVPRNCCSSTRREVNDNGKTGWSKLYLVVIKKTKVKVLEP
jgi:hypothetical protein